MVRMTNLTSGARFTLDQGTNAPRPFANGTDLFNFAPYNLLLTPSERRSISTPKDRSSVANPAASFTRCRK